MSAAALNLSGNQFSQFCLVIAINNRILPECNLLAQNLLNIIDSYEYKEQHFNN
jgi:hypothetical protein